MMYLKHNHKVVNKKNSKMKRNIFGRSNCVMNDEESACSSKNMMLTNGLVPMNLTPFFK